VRLADLERHLKGVSQEPPSLRSLFERADRVLAADGGRDSNRVPSECQRKDEEKHAGARDDWYPRIQGKRATGGTENGGQAGGGGRTL